MSMQLVEYFTWENLNNKKMNTFLSKIALFLVFVQVPLFILSRSKVESKLKFLLIGFYLLFTLFIMLYFPINFSMNKAQNGHLAWNWLKFPTIIICIWISFIGGLLLYEKRYFESIIYSIVVLAIYYTSYKTNTWGSLWCWIANIIALQLILKVFLNSNSSNCLLFKPNCK